MTDENIAIYLDFENLVLSAEEVYPSKGKPLSLRPVIDFITTRGNICIKKAYADWSKHIFSQYQRSLIEHGFEMIHLPATAQGKNGADVRLAIDAIENMGSFEILDTFVIGSGDTDFIPLIQHIRARGKKLMVLGFEHSVGSLIKTTCTEFKSLDELLGIPEKESLSSDLVQERDSTYGRDLLIRYVGNKSDEEPVHMAKLKLDLLRLDPSFSEKKLGFSSFKKFVESLLGDIVEEITLDDSNYPIVHFKEVKLAPKKEIDISVQAKEFLQKNLKYLGESSKRSELTRSLFEAFQDSKEISMNDMREEMYNRTKGISKVNIRKFINTLFTAGAFIRVEEVNNESLLNRQLKLHETINNPESLEQFYENRILWILKGRFPDLSEENINVLL